MPPAVRYPSVPLEVEEIACITHLGGGLVMPCECAGLNLVPSGSCDRNPALDVSSEVDGVNCHAG